MNTNSNVDISSIMEKMIVQLSCKELCALMQFAAAESLVGDGTATSKKIHQVVGVTPLATELGCSASFLYALKAKGILNRSIICHIGKKAVFNVDLARSLANEYQSEQRSMRQDKIAHLTVG